MAIYIFSLKKNCLRILLAKGPMIGIATYNFSTTKLINYVWFIYHLNSMFCHKGLSDVIMTKQLPRFHVPFLSKP